MNVAAPISNRAAIAPIWWPVVVPTFAYTTGAGAIVPALVLTGKDLGMSAAQISLVVTWLGLCAVAGSLVGGAAVARLGERRALLFATLAGNAALAAMLIWLLLPGLSGNPGRSHAGGNQDGSHLGGGTASIIVFAAALSVVEIADGVWSLARQNLVAEKVPAAGRARAMSLYAGAQRSGRVVGPLLTALFVILGAVELAYMLHIALAFAAMVIVQRHTAQSDRTIGSRAAADGRYRLSRFEKRGFWLLGIGIVAVSIARTDRDLLLPLWGIDHLGLHGSNVALALALCAAIELLLFYPSGIALDRFGRAPVAAACLGLLGAGFLVMMLVDTVTGYFIGAALLGIESGSGAGIMKVLGADLAPAQIRARYLGWWNALSNSGNVLAPGLTALVLVAFPLTGALAAAGTVGVAGAVWMRAWIPRFIPHPADAPISTEPRQQTPKSPRMHQ